MHLWRGMEVTDGLILTTDLSVTDNKERFRVGIWGGTNARGSYKEFDYYLSCTYRGISLAIWDIYNFSPQTDYNNEDFSIIRPEKRDVLSMSPSSEPSAVAYL